MPNYFKNHEVEIIELYIFGFVLFFFFQNSERRERDTILIDGGILLQDEDDNKKLASLHEISACSEAFAFFFYMILHLRICKKLLS